MNKYKMGHLEGNFTPVLYIGHKVTKGPYLVMVAQNAMTLRRHVYGFMVNCIAFYFGSCVIRIAGNQTGSLRITQH